VARLVIILLLAVIVVGFLWPMLIRLYRGRTSDAMATARKRRNYFVPIAACVALSFLISAVLWWLRM
jgi:hypothetical protein